MTNIFIFESTYSTYTIHLPIEITFRTFIVLIHFNSYCFNELTVFINYFSFDLKDQHYRKNKKVNKTENKSDYNVMLMHQG